MNNIENINTAPIVKEVSEIITNSIDNKIEITLNKKFTPIKNLIGILLGTFGLAIVVAAFSFGAFNQKFNSFMETQEKINDKEATAIENFNNSLNGLSEEALIMHFSLSKLDPDLPPPIMTRGKVTNSKSLSQATN